MSEPTDRAIYAISLKAQINFDPARREYGASTREELIELFGIPERWPSTTRSFLWCHSSTVVHSFTGATTFGLEVPCTADLEVTASKYVAALPDGDVPITMHFTGRVLYQGPQRQVQAVHLPRSTAAWMCRTSGRRSIARRRARRAAARPAAAHAVAVIDFGTGGLDLAYQVMYGYDGLLMIDVSRQGGSPGTLYVMEVDEDEVAGGSVEDGEVLNPHGMDPETVLRFIKLTGGWPGEVVIVACEPQTVEEMGVGLSPAVEEAVDRAVDLVIETAKELLTDEAYAVDESA